MKSKRSKACAISKAVKERVYARDGGLCIICPRIGMPNAHYIPRSAGGLGVEENIVTLCLECHNEYDNGSKRQEYGERIERYLKSQYPNWDRNKLVYRRYEF